MRQAAHSFLQIRPGAQWRRTRRVWCAACIFYTRIISDVACIQQASYAVASALQRVHIGEKLVSDCYRQAGACGFRVLQFNAVVATNIHARHLYERLGFQQLGVIPGGFRMKDGHYEDICPYYREV